MPIQLTPEDVNNMVKDTLLKAGLGDLISKAINKVMSSSSFDNPVDKAVEQYVRSVALEAVRVRFLDEIKAEVVKAIEDKVTPEVIKRAVDKWVDHLISGVEKY